MAQFALHRGLKANIPSTIEDGAIWYTYDTGEVFIDYGDERKCINDIPTQLAELIADENNRTVTDEQIASWNLAVEKLETIEEGAQKNVQVDWKALTGDALILNKPLYYDTTENWNAQNTLVSDEGSYYVYSDYCTVDGITYPNIKVGDGKAYVVDLPFVAVNQAELAAHVNNNVIHITATERNFWNNKVTSYVSASDPETIILTKLDVT